MADARLVRWCLLLASASVVPGEDASATQVADAPVPVVDIEQIAQLEGPPDGPFGEVTDVALTDVGHVVVLDRLRGQVSAFTATGTHLWTSGRLGEGPGDLSGQSSDISDLPDGGVLVTDPGNLRASRWDSAGTFLESFPLQHMNSMGMVRKLEPLADGSMLAETMKVRQGQHSTSIGVSVWALDRRGEPIREVHAFDGIPPNISRVSTGFRMRMIPVSSLWTPLRDGRVAVGRSDQYRFAEIPGPAGEPRVSRNVEVRAVTAGERRRAMERVSNRPPNLRIVDDEFHAVTGRILFDRSSGVLWVSRGVGLIDREAPRGMEVGDPVRYDLFDWEHGRRLAVAVAPVGVVAADVSDGRVVGAKRGSNDEPYLFIGSVSRN